MSALSIILIFLGGFAAGIFFWEALDMYIKRKEPPKTEDPWENIVPHEMLPQDIPCDCPVCSLERRIESQQAQWN